MHSDVYTSIKGKARRKKGEKKVNGACGGGMGPGMPRGLGDLGATVAWGILPRCPAGQDKTSLECIHAYVCVCVCGYIQTFILLLYHTYIIKYFLPLFSKL